MHVNILRTFYILISALLVSYQVQSSDIKIGEKHHIHSQTLSEKREYWVSLPPSYEENNYKHYPVIYLPDADFNSFFQTFSGMTHQMASDASPKIPEMILIGIPSQQRVRDSAPTIIQ